MSEPDARVLLVRAADLSGAAAAAVRDQSLEAVATGCRDLTVDLSQVTRIDGAGAAALLTTAQALGREGGTLTLAFQERNQPYARLWTAGLMAIPGVGVAPMPPGGAVEDR
ncbi:STAS domain-containing protein [Yinghuangia aomiensis]